LAVIGWQFRLAGSPVFRGRRAAAGVT